MRIIDAELEETFSAKDAGVKISSDGYLIATPRIARTGIQLYTGAEMGMADKDVVRIYRPETEVFNPKAMASFAHRPVTDDHPGEDVTAENWSKYAVGQTGGEVARDGEFIRVPMMMMDQKTIKAFQSGKRELSAGYSTKIIVGEGVTPQGEAYDAMMTDIRANHLAVVTAARGGPMLRIGDARQFHDHKPEKKPMNTRAVLVDGITVQLEDQTASIVERAQQLAAKALADSASQIAVLTSQLSQANDATAAAVAAAQKAADEATAQIATLTQQLKDAAVTADKLDEMVATRAATFEKARSILGDSFDTKGKSDQDIRRATVAAKLGDACKAWNDDMIRASFDTLTAGVVVGTQPAGGGAAFAQIAGGFQDHAAPAGADAARAQALDGYSKKLTEAWKGGAAN